MHCASWALLVIAVADVCTAFSVSRGFPTPLGTRQHTCVSHAPRTPASTIGLMAQLRSNTQQPADTSATVVAAEARTKFMSTPSGKLLGKELQDKVSSGGGSSDSLLLSERVMSAADTIQRRKIMFRQYAADIQGKTGLGGFAALAYCRRCVCIRDIRTETNVQRSESR